MYAAENIISRRKLICGCDDKDPDCTCDAETDNQGTDGVNVNVIFDSGNTFSPYNYNPFVAKEERPVVSPHVVQPHVVQPQTVQPQIVEPHVIEPQVVLPQDTNPYIVNGRPHPGKVNRLVWPDYKRRQDKACVEVFYPEFL